MLKYLAEGRVIPERTVLSLPTVQGDMILWDGKPFTFRISLVLSRIFVLIDAPDNMSIADIRNLLFSLLGDVTNLICFKQVFGLSYEIDSITRIDDGYSEVLGVEGYVFDRLDEDSGLFTFRTIRKGDNYSVPVEMLQDMHFTRAAFELRCAIHYPHFTALHCRLAIEAIRNAFPGDTESIQWASMRTALKIDRSAFLSFKSAADDQRHGRNRDQTWEERKKAMQVAWETVNRYILHKNNDPALDAAVMLA
ncbi:hypothetical protein [Devosia sp.]|uniref:hypothetical protein n=1 Tax=Devosia sp. TaxID=1871048 RepID=UPI0035AF801F